MHLLKTFTRPIASLRATNIYANILAHILGTTKGFFNHTGKLDEYQMPLWYSSMYWEEC